MTKWIVRFNAANHSQKHDAIQIVSKNVAISAKELGFKEINFTGYSNLNNNPAKRRNILNTVLGVVQPGDLVVVQFPLWSNLNFQEEFINYLKDIRDIKLMALLHDIPTWMFTEGNEEYDRASDFWLQQLRKFDLLIVANQKVVTKLREDQVDIPMVAMHVWDYIYDGPLANKKYTKKLIYAGGREVVGLDYTSSTPLEFYDKTVAQSVLENPSVSWLGRVPSDEIVSQLNGGFGVVVSNNIKEKSNMNFVYYNQFNNPTKLSLYLAAGIPVIVPDHTAHAKWIKDAGIGLIVNDLNDIDRILTNVSIEDYQNMLKAVKPWQEAITSGYFIKRALLSAIRYEYLGFEDSLA